MISHIIIFIIKAIIESIQGILMIPLSAFIFTEKPILTYIDTPRNKAIAHILAEKVSRFCPSPWAPGPRSQTFFCNILKRHSLEYTRRQEVAMPDGVIVHLDWKEKAYLPPDAPLLFVCHGVGGSSASRDPRMITDMAYKQGWRSVVYNRRGHGDSSLMPLSNCSLIHHKAFPMHADIEDCDVAVRAVHTAFPDAPKIMVGFSAGGNLTVKYLGAFKTTPFLAGVSLCNAHELVPLMKACVDIPDSSALACNALQDIVKKQLHVLRATCDKRNIEMDFDDILKETNMRKLESKLILPFYQEFADIDDYLRENSCHLSFKDIKVPLLSMASLDDPIIPSHLAQHHIKASKTNPNVFSITTKRGGHLAWLTGWKGDSWVHDILLQYTTFMFGMG